MSELDPHPPQGHDGHDGHDAAPTADDVRTPLRAYRVMATIVGVLLVVLCLVGLPLHYGYWVSDAAWLAKDSGAGWELGSNISEYLGVAHGWLYMIFLFCAFWLSRRARWELGFTAVTLLSGTVPLLSFWAEHRATRRVRAEVPELAAAR